MESGRALGQGRHIPMPLFLWHPLNRHVTVEENALLCHGKQSVNICGAVHIMSIQILSEILLAAIVVIWVWRTFWV